MKILRAHRLKLYPTRAQSEVLARHAGSCRWLWNHLLALQMQTYAETGKFVFFHEMSKSLPGLKRDHPWLAGAPSNALVRVCHNLDRALKSSFREGRGFPRFKKKGASREAFYVINQAFRVEPSGRRCALPKLGEVRFRTGRQPEGRIAGANVSFDGRDWWCAVQCETDLNLDPVAVDLDLVVGADLGLKELLVASDGQRVVAPRGLRKAQRRLRRAQRMLARRRKGSANRRRQVARVAALHRQVRDCRRDVQHKATAALVARASAVITETPNVRGMTRNRRLALSFADAGWGETLRQVAYKCEAAGKPHIQVGRFEPTTQTCSSCGARKTGEHKLRLHHRTYRCDCGAVLDRDLNAALNLRRLGLEALAAGQPIVLNDVGQAMPERSEAHAPLDACGDPSAGPEAQAAVRYGSLKQEVPEG